MPHHPDNEAGYWESPAISALHDELLEMAGTSWDDWSDFPRAWFDTPIAASFEERFAAVVREDYGDAHLIVIKDPRACRLVPMWLSIFGAMDIEPSIVIPIRNPIEVAESLRARDGFSYRKSFRIWLGNLLASERDSRMVKRSFVSYTHLLEDWRGVIEKISTDIDLDWPLRSDSSDHAVDGFLQMTLRHNASTLAELNTSRKVPSNVRSVYLHAIRVAEGGSIDTSIFDAIHNNVPIVCQKRSLFFRWFRRPSEIAMSKLGRAFARALRQTLRVQAILLERTGRHYS